MSSRRILILLFVFSLIILYSAPSFAQNITKEDALKAIEQAKLDMQKMIEYGFSIKYINDTLIEARQSLERADFAELIRQNITGELAEQARKALEGLNYEGFTYNEVIKHINKITEWKERTIELYDSIKASEIKVKEYKKQGVNTSEAEKILEDIRIAFEYEHYKETETLLSEVNSELENRKAEFATINTLLKSGKSFIEKNMNEIIILVVIIVIISYISWKKIKIKRIRNELKKLRIEKKSLIILIKKAQTDRFKKKKISESVYNIRIEKYTNRINEIKQTIPVLEAMLKKQKK